jgi:hypothetical protein
MSSELQVLRSLVPQFQARDRTAYDAFAAIARLPKGKSLDGSFLEQFYRLADRTLLCPDERKVRNPVLISPSGERRTLSGSPPWMDATFLAPTVEEWLLLEGLETLGGHSYAFEYRRLALQAWNALPNGMKEPYKPIYNLGVSWQPWKPEPAWQWLYLVFRWLKGRGSLVGSHRIGDIELVYLSVGLFGASAMVAACVEPADDLAGVTPHWDRKRKELRVGQGTPYRFPRFAPALFLLLDAFQKKGWPTSIPNPLTHYSLKDAVDSLNNKCAVIGLHFTRRDRDTEVAWDITPV